MYRHAAIKNGARPESAIWRQLEQLQFPDGKGPRTVMAAMYSPVQIQEATVPGPRQFEQVEFRDL